MNGTCTRRHAGRAAACAVVLAVLLVPRGAHADAVTSRPPACPEGTTPSFCHLGGTQLCVASPCGPDGACAADQTCERRAVCRRATHCGSVLRLPDGGYPPEAVAAVTCAPGTTCGGSTDCADQDVCVTVPRSGGCGCDVPGAGGIAGGMTLTLGVLAWLTVRRRRGAAR